MSKQDMLKVQTCVLRVNIHCEGCMHKVKKKLQKVEGVYKVSIDADQGKVVVSGNADPARLIEKLEKAGKHAELWGPQMQQFPISHEQMKKFQIESLSKSNNNNQKKQVLNMKSNGFVQLPLKKGGSKDEKILPAKDHKSVRFELPEEEDDDDDDDDDYDDDEDDYDDDEEDDFEDRFGDLKNHHGKPLVKGAVVGQKLSKGDKGGGGGGGKEGKAKKKGGGGGGIDMFIKSMLKKAGGKKGKSEKSGKKGEKKKEDGSGGGGVGGGKKGGFELGDGKKGKNDDNWSKKSVENFNFHGGKQHPQQHQQQQQHKGGGGGGGGGRNMEMMGGMAAVAGLPAMNGGRFPGVGPGNPYSQQQYMAQMNQMMMMNQMNQQQRESGHDAAAAYHHQMAYARPPPPMMGYGGPPPMMGYGPPAASGEYAHMFSDENTDSCGIM